MHESTKNNVAPQPACMVISYHYPPILHSSGLLRILAFIKALSDSGWDITVLSCDIKAYLHTHSGQSQLLATNVTLERCFARHTVKSLSWRRKYFDWMALPDALQSWILPAIWRGRRLIKKRRIVSILSSYPIASAHVIAYALCRLTGVNWLADLRDPMLQPDYPSGRLRRWLYDALERRIFRYASWVTVTTESTAQFYRQRFPQHANKIVIIPNGYDHSLLKDADVEPAVTATVTLLHSGMLNTADRDPTALLNALQHLQQQGVITPANFSLLFRAPDQVAMLQQLINQRQLNDLVKIGPAIPYQNAIAEMQHAKALLVLQGESCNLQIPAKLYEYLYCRRPLLALCHPDGEVANICQKLNVGICAPLDDEKAIKAAIVQLLQQLATQSASVLSEHQLPQLSREQHAIRIADLMRPQ